MVAVAAFLVPAVNGRGAEPFPWFVLGAVLLGAWLVLFSVVAAATMPRLPDPGPATMELGPDPPAIANFLTHRWKMTSAAPSATLVDLAARRHLDIERIGDGTMLLRVRNARAHDDVLTDYEHRVLQLVRSRAVNNEVPAPALLEGASDKWFDDFRQAVEKEARSSGLARSRWSPSVVAVLAPTLFLALLPISLAIDIWQPDNTVPPPDRDWTGLAGMAALAAVALLFVGSRWLRGLRHTKSGQRAAAQWLGVREFYDESGSFHDLDADAVAVWDRQIAYACAVGEAPVVSATFPLAPEPPDEAWSPASGLWREVEVRVPRREGEGMAPSKAMLRGAAFSVLGVLVWLFGFWIFRMIIFRPLADTIRGGDSLLMIAFVAGLALILAIPLLFGSLLLWRWLPVLLAAVQDGSNRTTFEGVIVKFPKRTVRSSSNNPEVILYTAVDDGSRRPVRALRFREPSIPIYRRVRVEMSPRLRHVYRVEPVGDERHDASAKPRFAPLPPPTAPGSLPPQVMPSPQVMPPPSGRPLPPPLPPGV